MSDASAVRPDDEQPHAVGPELSWRESYAFELYDPACELAGAAHLDVKPNEGAMDVGLSFFLDDGGFITARHVEPRSENTAALEVEGVRFEMLEPLRRWRLTYDGPSHSLASVADAGKREAWAKSRLERLIVEPEFTASHAAVAGHEGFAQAGAFTGEVWVSGDRYEVRARGVREKTWGLARLPRMQRRFALRFDDDSAIVAVQSVLDDGTSRQHGWILRDGRTSLVRSIALATQTAPGSVLQKAFDLVLLDDDGHRHEIAGTLLHVAPLPGFRGGSDTLLGDGVARVVYEGRTGFGTAAYLHRLDADGNPVEPVT